jgi:hypothetical protein
MKEKHLKGSYSLKFDFLFQFTTATVYSNIENLRENLIDLYYSNAENI